MIPRRALSLLFASILMTSMLPSGIWARENEKTADHSLLLFISSQLKLAGKEGPNEVSILIEHYRGYMQNLEKSKEFYEGQQEIIEDLLVEELENKLKVLEEQAAKVDDTRTRRKKTVVKQIFHAIGWFGKRVANVVGKIVVGTIRVAGKILKYVIEEELPRQIKSILLGRLEELKALVQGRIDLFWEKLAERYGPLADLLRSKIDPIFIRARDHILVKFRLKRAPGEEEGDGEDGEITLEGSEKEFWGHISNRMVYEDFLVLGGDDFWSPVQIERVWHITGGTYNDTLTLDEWLGARPEVDFCVRVKKVIFKLDVDVNDMTISGTFSGEASTPPADTYSCGLIYDEDGTTLIDIHPDVAKSLDVAYDAAGTFTKGKIRGKLWAWDEDNLNFTGVVDVSLTFSKAKYRLGGISYDTPELIDGWGPDALQGASVSRIDWYIESTAPVTRDLTGEIKGNLDYIRIDCGAGDVTLNLFCNATGVELMLAE